MANLQPLNGNMTLREAWPKIEANDEALNTELAAQSDRIDNIVAQSGDDITEIVDARQPESGTAYPTLKERLDTEHGELRAEQGAQAAQLADTVNMSGTQTIAGAKTFTSPLNVQNGKTLDMYSPSLAVDANRYSLQLQEGVLRLFALSSAGAWQRNLFEFSHNGNYVYFGNGNIKLMHGTAAPEGSVTATTGSLYIKPNSPAKLYLKETGTGNTGWKEVALV